MNSSHKGRRRRALMSSLICAWTNGWVNNRDAGNLRRHRSHYDVTLMFFYDSGVSFECIHINVKPCSSELCSVHLVVRMPGNQWSNPGRYWKHLRVNVSFQFKCSSSLSSVYTDCSAQAVFLRWASKFIISFSDKTGHIFDQLNYTFLLHCFTWKPLHAD